MSYCLATAHARAVPYAEHEPEMYNETDAIAFAIVCLNDDEDNLANVCKYCGCLYPAEIWREGIAGRWRKK